MTAARLVGDLATVLQTAATFRARGGGIVHWSTGLPIERDDDTNVDVAIDIATGELVAATWQPDCTIRVPHKTLLDMASGALDRVAAVTGGHMQVSGAAWIAFGLLEICSAVGGRFLHPRGVATVLRRAHSLARHGGGTVLHEIVGTQPFAVDSTHGGKVAAAAGGDSPGHAASMKLEAGAMHLIASGQVDRVEAIMSGQLRLHGDTWLVFALFEVYATVVRRAETGEAASPLIASPTASGPALTGARRVQSAGGTASRGIDFGPRAQTLEDVPSAATSRGRCCDHAPAQGPAASAARGAGASRPAGQAMATAEVSPVDTSPPPHASASAHPLGHASSFPCSAFARATPTTSAAAAAAFATARNRLSREASKSASVCSSFPSSPLASPARSELGDGRDPLPSAALPPMTGAGLRVAPGMADNDARLSESSQDSSLQAASFAPVNSECASLAATSSQTVTGGERAVHQHGAAAAHAQASLAAARSACVTAPVGQAAHARAQVKAARAPAHSPSANDPAPSTASASEKATEKARLAEWVVRYARGGKHSGKPYWHNPRTGVSTWRDPSTIGATPRRLDSAHNGRGSTGHEANGGGVKAVAGADVAGGCAGGAKSSSHLSPCAKTDQPIAAAVADDAAAIVTASGGEAAHRSAPGAAVSTSKPRSPAHEATSPSAGGFAKGQLLEAAQRAARAASSSAAPTPPAARGVPMTWLMRAMD